MLLYTEVGVTLIRSDSPISRLNFYRFFFSIDIILFCMHMEGKVLTYSRYPSDFERLRKFLRLQANEDIRLNLSIVVIERSFASFAYHCQEEYTRFTKRISFEFSHAPSRKY